MGSGTSPKGSPGGGNATPGNEKKGKAKPEGPLLEDVQTCCGCRFPLLVAVFQLLLGIAVAGVAFVMVAISPSLLARETPHWAGIIVSFLLLFINLSLNSQHALFYSFMHEAIASDSLAAQPYTVHKHTSMLLERACAHPSTKIIATFTLQGFFFVFLKWV